MQFLSHFVGGERQEVDLDIGRRKPGTGLEECARRPGRDRQWSGAERRVSQAGQDFAGWAVDDVVERHALRTTHHHPYLHVVLQIVSYPRRIEHDLDAVVSQQFSRADAGELQQLRRIVRAAGNQYLLPRARRVD